MPSECVAIADNSGLGTLGLRMSQITFTKPLAFTTPVIKSVFEASVTMNLPGCNLAGEGNFSWLIEVDTVSQKLTTGGATPAADPTAGYCFVDGSLDGHAVAPLAVGGTVGPSGALVMSTGGNVTLPVFLSQDATDFLLLPLRNLKLLDAQVSPDHNCIGHYNADQLSPADSCGPSQGVQLFTEAGTIDAHIALEDADSVIIAALNQSLCVLLTGDAGNGQIPKLCARDAGNNIIAKGDWCSATDSQGGCMDSMKVLAGFAASAVTINGNCP